MSKDRLRDKSYFEKETKRIAPKEISVISLRRLQKEDSSAIVTFNCAKHGPFKQSWHDFRSRVRKGRHPCTTCNLSIRANRTLERYLGRARKIHGNFYSYEKVVFNNANEKVKITCPLHGVFLQTLSTHVDRKSNCPKCARERLRNTTPVFIEKAIRVHGERYDYSLVECNFTSDKVKIICKKHGVFEQVCHSHLEGSGCAKCAKEKGLKGTEKFIQEARLIHGNKYDYSLVDYKGQRVKIKIICPKHGLFEQLPFSHVITRCGCPRCLESYGERRVAMFLEKRGIKFIKEYRLPNSKFRFDFFLPDFNVFIEFHGIQHYLPVKRFGGREGLNRVKERDALKEALATTYNIPLIVLNFDSLRCKDIEKSFSNKFKKHFLYWCRTKDGFKRFRSIFEIVDFYDIRDNFPIKEIISIVRKEYDSDFDILI